MTCAILLAVHRLRRSDTAILLCTGIDGTAKQSSAGFRNHYGQMVEGIDAWFKGEPVRRLA